MATTLTKDPISGSYIVKTGDTLSKIASTQGRTLAELLASNPQYAANPNLIKPGQVIQPKVSSVATPAPVQNKVPALATLTQGQSFTDPAGRTGTVNFSTTDGSRLAPGATTPLNPTYQNLTGGNESTTTPTAEPTREATTFTEALIKILKEAQGRNASGQERLYKQSQGITGNALNDSTRNFKNPLLAPNSGTSLGLSAANEFDPLITSVGNQQKLATQNLSDIKDILKVTGDNYTDTLDREFKEKKELADEAYRQKSLSASSSDPYKNYSAKLAVAQAQAQSKIAIAMENAPRDSDGYVTPEAYRNLKQAWIVDGFSGANFDKIFSGQVNPTRAELYSVNFVTKVSSNEDDGGIDFSAIPYEQP